MMREGALKDKVVFLHSINYVLLKPKDKFHHSLAYTPKSSFHKKDNQFMVVYLHK